MTVRIKSGDLLKEESDAIVNTVNCVGVMGKGVALQFKQRWPENFKDYETACKREEIRPGKMFIHDLGKWSKPRFIINFPTKVHWRRDSKLEYVEDGLRDLVKQVKRLGIKSISLPPLGCGNGGLDWDEVRDLVFAALKDHPDISVNLFEPKGAPQPLEMTIRTSGDEDLGNHVGRVRNLIKGFETPYGMELLSSVHWVATQGPNVRNADEAVVAVHNWNARKRAVLREDHIRLAWDRLKDEGWFAPLRQTKKDPLAFH